MFLLVDFCCASTWNLPEVNAQQKSGKHWVLQQIFVIIFCMVDCVGFVCVLHGGLFGGSVFYFAWLYGVFANVMFLLAYFCCAYTWNLPEVNAQRKSGKLATAE